MNTYHRLSIIDLDGCVADGTARFARAEKAKQTFLESIPEATEKEAMGIYWTTAFTPSFVELDEYIPDTNDALLTIQERGYKLVFLTSRPEHMRKATEEWLFRNTIYDGDDTLIMKAPAFQFVKTTVWKAGMVHTLAIFYGASDLLVIENEQANIDEILKNSATFAFEWLICKSLQEAVNALTE